MNVLLAQKIVQLLKDQKATVSTAESCTGGLLAASLTEIPGSSVVYHGGAIVYTNEEKTRSCGVPKETIEQFGAVSWQVVEALARGIRDRVGTTYGIAITGIAGPGGATESKPVGRVCIGIAHPEGVDVAVYDFKPTEPSHGAGTFSDLIHTLDRHTIRELNVEKALAMLEKRILYNADL